MTDPVSLKVFVCYASEDEAVIQQLHTRLSLDGCTPWLDKTDILPGQHWETEIKTAIRNSDVVLVCLSRKSTTKRGFVHKELRYVLDAATERPPDKVFAIPVILEECEVPEQLNHLQRVNPFSEDGYDRLLRVLNLVRMQLGRSSTLIAP